MTNFKCIFEFLSLYGGTKLIANPKNRNYDGELHRKINDMKKIAYDEAWSKIFEDISKKLNSTAEKIQDSKQQWQNSGNIHDYFWIRIKDKNKQDLASCISLFAYKDRISVTVEYHHSFKNSRNTLKEHNNYFFHIDKFINSNNLDIGKYYIWYENKFNAQNNDWYNEESESIHKESLKEIIRNKEIKINIEDSIKRYENYRVTISKEFSKEYVLNSIDFDLEVAQSVNELDILYNKATEIISEYKFKEYEYIGEKNELYSKECMIEDILKDIFLEKSKIEDIIFNLDKKKNIILQGPPGVGKTFVAKKLCNLHQGHICSEEQIETIQFHQSYSYEDFIRGYRPNKNGGFELKDGIFYKFTQKAINNPNKNFYIIIDEINRGNLSKIFGELMMLIEHDKRGEENRVTLTYQEDDEKFFIPKNLYIIGTMNTADRSLAMVDYALRRRFAFIDIEPAFDNVVLKNHFEKYLGEDITSKIINKITKLNNEIEKDHLDLGKGYRIGHSYFTPISKIDDVERWYKNIIKMEIEPLIREYWFDKSEVEIQEKVADLLED